MSETIVFEGASYHRYPLSPHRHLRCYYGNGKTSLHRAIWASAHGPIPAGAHIHHRDGDPLNNTLENLECVEARAHLSAHGQSRPTIRCFCSACGREFDARTTWARFCSNACKASWRRRAGLDDVRRSCVICGENFVVNRYTKTRTCSRACHGRLSGKARAGRPQTRRVSGAAAKLSNIE